MIRNQNIVCIASNWFEHPTSKQHVMRALAQHNRVVWVNFHASRRPKLNMIDLQAIGRRLTQIVAGSQQVTAGRFTTPASIEVLSPLLIPWPEAIIARRINAWNIARQVRTALRSTAGRATQLWLFTPDVPELIPALNPEHVVYYCVDDFAAFEGYNTNLVERLERQTVQAADTVIATSKPLMEKLQACGAAPHLITHGVDTAHFAQATQPTDEPTPECIRHVPHPILGFFGLVTEWVDLELLRAVAQRRRDWQIVLLGCARVDTSQLAAEPNIHLIGPQPYEALPEFCRAFDVGLIPFRMNRLIQAVNPIKLREYLAAGLPVVSAPMPAVLEYQPGVYPAQTADEFITATEAALSANSPANVAARQALVANESWAAKVAHLSDIIQASPRRRYPESTQPATI
jgi:glycosyltransferase involved in cell wall biosynthesis